jgi:photosystem II stability/assembly factor-like uncharacterized protein
MKTNILTILFIIASAGYLCAQQGWNYQNPNLTVQNQHGAICPINKDTVCVIADNGKFLSTTDGGTTWLERNTGVQVLFFDISFINYNLGYAAGQGGTILKTGDWGTCWNTMNTGTQADLFSVCIKAENDIWAVGDSGVIIHSTDYGLTWVKLPAVTNLMLNSIAFRGDTGIIVGNHGTLLRSVDNGATWIPGNPGTTEDISSLVMTPHYAYALAGVSYPYGFQGTEALRSGDLNSWVSFSGPGQFGGLSKIDFARDSTGFGITSGVITDGYGFIYIDKTTDSGESWFDSFINYEAPYPVAWGDCDIKFVTDSIGYALCGNNILKTIDGGKLVGIKEIDPLRSFSIYPNPSASDAINISFSNFTPEKSSLEIVDLNGRTLLNTRVAANPQSINISGLEKGVYFINLMNGKRIIGVERFVKE